MHLPAQAGRLLEGCKTLREIELAWCAGFLDGEGYFGSSRESGGKHKFRFRISCAQVHEEPLERLARTLGGKVYGPYGPYSGNRQAHYQWMVFGEEAASVVDTLKPYLCSIKIEQAQLAMEKWRADINA